MEGESRWRRALLYFGLVGQPERPKQPWYGTGGPVWWLQPLLVVLIAFTVVDNLLEWRGLWSAVVVVAGTAFVALLAASIVARWVVSRRDAV
jgi:hypothetical protein